MLNLQRVVALLMATVFVCVFLVPLAFRRHQVALAIGLLALYFVYVGVNAYIFVRMRRAGPR